MSQRLLENAEKHQKSAKKTCKTRREKQWIVWSGPLDRPQEACLEYIPRWSRENPPIWAVWAQESMSRLARLFITALLNRFWIGKCLLHHGACSCKGWDWRIEGIEGSRLGRHAQAILTIATPGQNSADDVNHFVYRDFNSVEAHAHSSRVEYWQPYLVGAPQNGGYSPSSPLQKANHEAGTLRFSLRHWSLVSSKPRSFPHHGWFM